MEPTGLLLRLLLLLVPPGALPALLLLLPPSLLVVLVDGGLPLQGWQLTAAGLPQQPRPRDPPAATPAHGRQGPCKLA